MIGGTVQNAPSGHRWGLVRMVKHMGQGPAAQVAQVAQAALAVQAAQAADAEPSSRDAIMSTTRSGVVSSWNSPAVLLYGYLAEEIVGRAADVLCPPEEREHETEALQR